MKNLQLVLSCMAGRKVTYLTAILCAGIATLFSLIPVLVVRVTIDSVIGEEPFALPYQLMGTIDAFGGRQGLLQRLWLPALLVVGMTVAGGLFLFLRGRLAAVAAEEMAKRLRERLYSHLQSLPYAYHLQANTGDLLQRCSSDLETVRRFIATQFVELGRAFFLVTAITWIMASLHLHMTLVAISLIPVIFGFSIIFFGRVRTAFKKSDEAEARMSTVLQENLTGVRVVRAFAREAYEMEKFAEKNVEFRDLTYRLIRLLAGFWSCSDFLSMAQVGAVLIVGVYWTVTGSLTLGTLVVFIAYEGMLIWPIRQMGRIIADMGRSSVALKRMREVLEEPAEELDPSAHRPKIRGDIAFERVSFAYDSGQPVLREVSFRARAGETVAIVGPTGSGKSSLVHLLTGLFDYQEGSIRIDGHELKAIDRRWLRRHVGLVLQEPFLFARSLRENIALAVPDTDEARVHRVARMASLHEEVAAFDRGYDTIVGERGVSLSGGQKQRVAIARNLIRDCPVMIFDDSLSAVDTETEVRIRSALTGSGKDRTLFIISHRISTVAAADRILVMERGRIVQSGPHEELIAREGLYRRMWLLQTAGRRSRSRVHGEEGEVALDGGAT